MRKKRILFFAALLGIVLLLLPGALAAEADDGVFSVEAAAGVPYDGYLVSVRPDARPRISPLAMGAETLVDDIYLVDSVAVIEQLFRADQILYIEPNYQVTLFSTPNDPLFHTWQWCMRMIQAPILWDRDITGAGVRVGVIDSGMVSGHEDIDPARIAPGWNFIDRNQDVQDHFGHGTRVTGIIAASRNNGIGIAGLTDQVTIVPLKIFQGRTTNMDVVVRAIHDAVDVFQVDVINMSFGVRGVAGQMQTLRQAVDHAIDSGVIVVAAAGNYGNTAHVYPASFPNVVSVAAVDSEGTVARFSQRNTGLTVAAPGVHIITLGHDEHSYVADDSTSGTSFSAPFVTAMAAVAREIHPDLNQSEFMSLLRQSAVDRDPAGFDTMYGYGLVCINRFLALLPGIAWFNDISGHWARDGILHMAELGLVHGDGSGGFAPRQAMDRAELVTLLGRSYRRMGGTIPVRNDPFPDTRPNSWYSSYVAWAAEAEIVRGTDDGLFLPHDHATRETVATILARFAAYIGLCTDGDLNALQGFVDADQVASWSRDAVAWMAEQGILGGVPVPGGLAIRPATPTERAELAILLLRFVDLMEIDLGVAA